MSEVKLENISKIYPNGVQAVHNFNISIKDKEFIVFVGPSGCGKTTTLRMIAGLEDITSGKLYIDNRLCNDESPKDRDIAMVFQSYALYPHMTVYKNMAFGLKMRLVPSPVMDENGQPVLVIDNAKVRSLRKDRRRVEKYMKNAAQSQKKLNARVNKDIKEMESMLKKGGLSGPKEEELKKNIPLYKAYSKKYKEDFDNRMIEMKEKIVGIEEKISYFEKTPVQKVSFHHIPKKEIDERVHNAAKILEIEDYLDRKPNALSGGQRQRVALGRAIVRKAKVFLMDEPLSNLDAKLRVQMRTEIIKLHERLNATTIYVTHDQTEAMTMATRIVVMKDGYIQQIGTPKEIYMHPDNKFVAGFIGSPSMNFLKVPYKDGSIQIEGNFFPVDAAAVEKLKDYDGKFVTLGIRPENIMVSLKHEKGYVEKEVQISELLGSELILHFDLADSSFSAKTPSNKEVPAHTKVYLKLDSSMMHFFDVETEKTIV